MQPETITSVDTSEEANVTATLVSAFIADPVERWLFAEPLQYLTHFPTFVAAFGMGCGGRPSHERHPSAARRDEPMPRASRDAPACSCTTYRGSDSRDTKRP